MTLKENVFDVEALEEQIKIANKQKDDYAIEFSNWVNKVSYRSFDGNWYLTQNEEDIKKTTEELLEIFKKEKGL